MICKACNSVTNASESDDCFEKALDVLKKHYTFYKNALLQRDLELRQIKERNEKLNKALQLLQQQQPAAKRFKSQNIDDCWSGNNSTQEERVNSDLSLTDDEPICVTNLNIALNSEQLFDTSALSQSKNEVSLLTTSSELVQSPRTKESHKRNKQRDTMRCLKDRNKTLGRSKSEWHTKDRKSPAEKSWAMKFLQADNTKDRANNTSGESKNTADKRLCLSLKKPNPSKIKQSLLNFNKINDGSFRETEDCEDIIEASPVIPQKNPKAGRSWAHRSGHNHSSNATSNNSTNVSANVTNKKADNDDSNKHLDDIVFDFSPSKKTDSDSTKLDLNSPKTKQPKQLKFDNDTSTDCTSLPKEVLEFSTNKTDTSSVVILTPSSQDIIFVDDTCDYDQEIDTMDLLDDNLEKLKKYESKCIQKQQNKELDVFKKPQDKLSTNKDIKVKQEQITQDLKEEIKLKPNEEKPSCSSTASSSSKTTKSQKNLGSFHEHDTEDEEDFMPKPFIVKQEPKLSIKQRFNIDCEDCEKLINFLDKGLTDVQIQQHLDKCKRHNNADIMRQNTPKDFWNPFILSFQADDPRNEVLIDNRFKDSKK